MKSDQLPLAHATMSALLEMIPVGIIVQDEFGRIVWVNAELERQMGRKRRSLIGYTQDALPLVASQHQIGDGLLCHLPDAREDGVQWLVRIDASLPGEEMPVDVSFFVDVTREEHARVQVDRLHQALRGQVATDQATGLPTRKSTLAQLDAQVSRSRRYHNLLSVALLRVQCATSATSKPGQPVLQAIGNLLRDQTRWPDIVGRWDEHSFLLVLPETAGSSARALTQKIADRLADDPRRELTAGAECELAWGVADWCKGDNAADLVNKAIEDLVSNLELEPVVSINAGKS